MSRKKPHHTKQFKLDAINYRKEHPDLTQVECAKNLGIGVSTLARWEAQFRDNDGDIPTIGSGCYESEEQREIARLKRELRDTQDALVFVSAYHQPLMQAGFLREILKASNIPPPQQFHEPLQFLFHISACEWEKIIFLCCNMFCSI